MDLNGMGLGGLRARASSDKASGISGQGTDDLVFIKYL